MKKNLSFKIIAILSVLIFLLTLTFLCFDYKKQSNKNKTELELLELKQAQEEKKQRDLKNCIQDAKTARTGLWNANCPDGESGCSLNQTTIKWIDNRYEQDIRNCNSLYN